MILPGEFQRRGGTMYGAPSPGGRRTAMSFVFDELVFPAIHVAPLADGDHAGDDEAVVGQRLFHLAHFTAAPDEIIDVIDPQLDAVAAGCPDSSIFFNKGWGLMVLVLRQNFIGTDVKGSQPKAKLYDGVTRIHLFLLVPM